MNHEASTRSGLFRPTPRARVIQDVIGRNRRFLKGLPDLVLRDLVEDAAWCERQRLRNRPPGSGPPVPGEMDRVEEARRALLREDRGAWTAAALDLVEAWTDEIHGQFSQRAYQFATGMMPRALAALLSGKPDHLQSWDLTVDHRLICEGPVELLRQLTSEATLVFVPTHVSNLDSPIIGLALSEVGLPPAVYGAGLNLFNNPVMGWWMRRLGAYTVDRTKRARLYKHVLKDYSVNRLVSRHHSLFFPGGTRSRSGALESRLKKGLMGTGITAWQEMIASGRPVSGPNGADVYFVPMTLSFQLVLEANTLINDHLAEAGKQRFIITDDEFSKPRTIVRFVHRVLNHDSSIVVRFGDPIDPLGFKVPHDPAERAAASRARLGYISGKDGEIETDLQRDREYTDRLAVSIASAYASDTTVLVTHTAAWTAWRLLEDRVNTTDPFRIVRAPSELRQFPHHEYLARLQRTVDAIHANAAQGRYHARLPTTASAVLDSAIEAFDRYHRSRVLTRKRDLIRVDDPKLCLYYRNRLTFAGLED